MILLRSVLRLYSSESLRIVCAHQLSAYSRHLHTSICLNKIVPFKLSDIGEGIAEVQIKEWHVKVGDTVSQFDALCEVQSDKASVTITSRFDGTIACIHHAVDATARVGQPLCDIDVKDAEGAVETAQPAKQASTPSQQQKPAHATEQTVTSSGKVLATPAVRRIAMENAVRLVDVAATGKDGRVLKEDLLRHISDGPKASGGQQAAVPAGTQRTYCPPVAARALTPGEDRVVPIKGYTRAMLRTMTEANTIPHFGYCDDVVVDRLVDLRDQLKSMAADRGVRMSYMPLFIKAASMALHEFPVLNSSIDANKENVIYKSAHNICVAIDTAGGLVVPNIKHCEQRNLWEIAQELNRLQAAADRQQLARDDLIDGTFTLSNIGSIGGTYAHPVIFPPQVAIGALGRICVEPRYDAGNQLHPVRVVRVSWCADHRVIDGATMARFSNRWKALLENPAMMIAQMR